MRCLGSSKKGLNTFSLRSSGSKYPAELKSNSAMKKSVSSSKWLNGSRVARQTEQNESLLVLDKAMYFSHGKECTLNVSSSDICHIKWLCDYYGC